jgi:cell division protein FtsW
MDAFFKRFFKGDATLWFVFFSLCAISALEMFSASSTLAYKASNYTTPVFRHIMFLGIGAFIAYFIHLLPYKYIRIAAYLMMALSVMSLVLVLFRGKSENDATRWLEIGGFQFQPSELGKLSLIIIAADLIARIKFSKVKENFYFRILLIVSGVVCALILLENFSTAILLFFVVLVMMFIGKVSSKKLIILVSSLVLVAVFGYLTIKIIPENKLPGFLDRAPTWINRIDRFVTEEDNPEDKYVINDENLQVQHGRIAIARGGFFGVFPGNSVQRDYLPQAYSDFIYAIIVEEMGLVGGVTVILLYMVLLYRAGRIATMSKTVFPAILVIGLSLMIVLQAFVSMAVATSLGPVTGQPLPLISRGGTSILITSIYFGIMFGINRQLREEVKNGPDKESYEEIELTSELEDN